MMIFDIENITVFCKLFNEACIYIRDPLYNKKFIYCNMILVSLLLYVEALKKKGRDKVVSSDQIQKKV